MRSDFAACAPLIVSTTSAHGRALKHRATAAAQIATIGFNHIGSR